MYWEQSNSFHLTDVKMPPNYHLRRSDFESHDFAMYILEREIMFTDNIRPICIPKQVSIIVVTQNLKKKRSLYIRSRTPWPLHCKNCRTLIFMVRWQQLLDGAGKAIKIGRVWKVIAMTIVDGPRGTWNNRFGSGWHTTPPPLPILFLFFSIIHDNFTIVGMIQRKMESRAWFWEI